MSQSSSVVNQNQFNIKNFKRRNFRGQDLKGMDFSYADIRGIDFSHTNLNGANFEGAKAGVCSFLKVLLASTLCLLLALSSIICTNTWFFTATRLIPRISRTYTLNIWVVVALLALITILFIVLIRQKYKTNGNKAESIFISTLSLKAPLLGMAAGLTVAAIATIASGSDLLTATALAIVGGLLSLVWG